MRGSYADAARSVSDARRGGELRGARVAYETWGELNAARDNAILLFTGLSPSAHAASSPADPSRAGGKR